MKRTNAFLCSIREEAVHRKQASMGPMQVWVSFVSVNCIQPEPMDQQEGQLKDRLEEDTNGLGSQQAPLIVTLPCSSVPYLNFLISFSCKCISILTPLLWATWSSSPFVFNFFSSCTTQNTFTTYKSVGTDPNMIYKIQKCTPEIRKDLSWQTFS